MPKTKSSVTLAAIDVGSNAIRLLISDITTTKEDTPKFRKTLLLRLPIRLGEDVFATGSISFEKQQALIKAFHSFKLLMEIHGVKDYRSTATSAMRNASNGELVAANIYKHTDIELDIISGEMESEILMFNHQMSAYIAQDKRVMYMDVGGGSTELNYIVNGVSQASHSFSIGTVRMLQNSLSDDVCNQMEAWCKDKKSDYILAVGGNINKIHKLNGLTESDPLDVSRLEAMHNQYATMSVSELVSKFSLKPDRADVIVYAQSIYLKVAKLVKASHYVVPKIGIADATVRKLYYDLYSK